VISSDNKQPPPGSSSLHHATWRRLTQLDAANRATMLARHTAQWQAVKQHAAAMTELAQAKAEGRPPRPQPMLGDEMNVTVGDNYHAPQPQPQSKLAATIAAAVTGAGVAAGGMYYAANKPTPEPTLAPVVTATDSNTIFFPLEP